MYLLKARVGIRDSNQAYMYIFLESECLENTVMLYFDADIVVELHLRYVYWLLQTPTQAFIHMFNLLLIRILTTSNSYSGF